MPSELAFPFAVDGNGGIAVVTSELDRARQHIVAAVGTHPTERVRRPLYGCQTMYYLFTSSDDPMTDLLEAEIRRAVEEFVPEVVLDEVVPQIGGSDGLVRVQLGFTLKRTGETAEVVTEVRTAIREGGIVTEES